MAIRTLVTQLGALHLIRRDADGGGESFAPPQPEGPAPTPIFTSPYDSPPIVMLPTPQSDAPPPPPTPTWATTIADAIDEQQRHPPALPVMDAPLPLFTVLSGEINTLQALLSPNSSVPQGTTLDSSIKLGLRAGDVANRAEAQANSAAQAAAAAGIQDGPAAQAAINASADATRAAVIAGQAAAQLTAFTPSLPDVNKLADALTKQADQTAAAAARAAAQAKGAAPTGSQQATDAAKVAAVAAGVSKSVTQMTRASGSGFGFLTFIGIAAGLGTLAFIFTRRNR